MIIQITEQDRVLLYYSLEYMLDMDKRYYRKDFFEDKENKVLMRRMLQILEQVASKKT